MADSPAVVLLHGFATSAARTWGQNGWVDMLGDMGREVIAPDLPGHGPAPQPHDAAAYADIEGPVAAALPDEPVDAIGFSMGARVLLGLAADDPGRFRRLVVAGVGANLFRDDRPGTIVRALRGEGDLSDPVVRYFAGLAAEGGADPLALAAFMEARRGPLTVERLAGVTCPTLVVLGDRDFAGPGEPLVEALPEARLVVLPRTDHFATPKAFGFMDAALDFVSQP